MNFTCMIRYGMQYQGVNYVSKIPAANYMYVALLHRFISNGLFYSVRHNHDQQSLWAGRIISGSQSLQDLAVGILNPFGERLITVYRRKTL